MRAVSEVNFNRLPRNCSVLEIIVFVSGADNIKRSWVVNMACSVTMLFRSIIIKKKNKPFNLPSRDMKGYKVVESRERLSL